MLNCPALILMTRWPVENRCKSRLAKDIGANKAALIQGRLNEHTFQVAKKLEKKNLVEIFIAISGLSSANSKVWSRKNGFKNITSQGTGSLGVRMRRQLLDVQINNQKRSSIIIGTDLPTLSERDLNEGIELLKKKQLVIGPSKDGGYWLIGLSGELLRPIPKWPFRDIPWGSNKVLSETLKLAVSKKINYALLQEKNDIDMLEDLDPWQP